MLDQYKTEEFPENQLLQLAEDVESLGWDAEVEWKNGLQKLEQPDKATGFYLRINGKLVLKQIKRNGTVRLNKLNKTNRPIFLDLLRKNELYNKPNWTLGVILALVYFSIVLIGIIEPASKMQEKLIPIVGGLMVLFIGIAFMRAKQLLPDGINILIWIIGILAVIASAPGSILIIPLVNTIYKYSLYNKVSRTPLAVS